MDKLDRLVWAASSTFVIGPYHIGIRSDSEWLDGLIRGALSQYHVYGVEAPSNFSVVLPGRNTGPAKALNMLYEGHTNLVRSRHPDRTLRALFQHLTKYVGIEGNGYLRVSDLAIIRNGRSILVPRAILTWIDQLAPRLNRAGWQFVDQPWSTLDLSTAELVVPPPVLELESSWENEMPVQQSKREPPAVEPGRYSLNGWAVLSADEGVMSKAASVAATTARVLNPMDIGVRETIQALVDLAERFSVTGLGSPFEGDFPARLTSVDGGQ